MLGAISKRIHFYLVTPREHASITAPSIEWMDIKFIKEEERLRLTIYAREIIAALAAGYEIKKLADKSEILVPSEHMRGLTLKELIAAVSHFEWTTDWQFLEQAKLKSIVFDFNKRDVSKFIHN